MRSTLIRTMGAGRPNLLPRALAGRLHKWIGEGRYASLAVVQSPPKRCVRTPVGRLAIIGLARVYERGE